MRMMTILTTLTILLAALTTAHSGDSGLSLLKNEHAARQAGMGAAAVATTADPNATVYNPAAAVGLDVFTASFGHTIHWENIRFESGYFGTGLWPNIYLHGGVRLAAVDEIEQRSIASDDPEALFDSHDLTGKLGLAYRINDKLSAGFGAGWVFEEIQGWRGSALNFDLGMIGQMTDRLALGASITGLGSDLNISKSGSVGSRPIPLPTTYRLGGSFQHGDYRAAADWVMLDSKGHLHVGAEATFKEQFGLRAGYMTGYDSKDFTAGASFSMRNVTVDYAFLPFSNDLGTSHLFNVTFTL